MVKPGKTMALQSEAPSTTATRQGVGTVAAVMSALLLGVFILYGAGFAGANVLHNAAHDGRHSFTFPCH